MNIRRIHASSQEEVHRAASKKRVRGLVLIVEDEPDVLSMVSEHLMAAGFDVCRAPNGEAALALIRERLPAVVCLDLNLPRISGYDVCEQIRADPAVRDVSILITSARNSLDVRVCALEAGADAYLIKPYALNQLTGAVERLFALRMGSMEGVEAIKLDRP